MHEVFRMKLLDVGEYSLESEVLDKSAGGLNQRFRVSLKFRQILYQHVFTFIGLALLLWWKGIEWKVQR